MHRAEADTAILGMGSWTSSSLSVRIFIKSEVTTDSCFVTAPLGSNLTSSFSKNYG